MTNDDQRLPPVDHAASISTCTTPVQSASMTLPPVDLAASISACDPPTTSVQSASMTLPPVDLAASISACDLPTTLVQPTTPLCYTPVNIIKKQYSLHSKRTQKSATGAEEGQQEAKGRIFIGTEEEFRTFVTNNLTKILILVDFVAT
jgi:hypothetical protein